MHSGGDYMLHCVCKFHKHILYRNFDLTLDNWLTGNLFLCTISPQYHTLRSQELEKMITKKETLDFKTNSPCQ